jgi:hypothetical protein
VKNQRIEDKRQKKKAKPVKEMVVEEKEYH